MTIKRLIDRQTIIIDDHKRGSGEVKNWDDKSVDVHIDKTTNFPIEGVRQHVRIKIPINSDRPIKIENAKKQQLNEIPNQLRREINRAFNNKKVRESFIRDILEHIQNFDTILNNEDRARQVLSNISKHFELNWTNEKIATYLNNVLSIYTEKYTDNRGQHFFITIDKEKIKIGESKIHKRHQKIIHLK
jgi:hypothetical protein